MQWLMLQSEKPKDYVIASKNQISVQGLYSISADNLGWGGIHWQGDGLMR